MHVAAARPVSRGTRIDSQRLVLAAGAVALAIVLFAAAMVAPLAYDEEQYVGGAVFARELSLYRDFISFQPPPYTWIVSWVFEAVDGWYLLSARVVTWAFALGSCLLLYSLLASCGAGRVVAVVLVVAFVTSPFSQRPLVETRNDVMPLFCMLAGLRLLLGAGDTPSASLARLLASGFFLSLAAATKYSYVFAAPIALAVLSFDAWRQRGSAPALAMPRVGAFVAGAAAGTLPLAYALLVHQDRFIFLTLGFFQDSSTFDWYRTHDAENLLTMKHKLELLPRQLIRHGNATILLVFVFSALALACTVARDRWWRLRWQPSTALVAAMFVGSLALAVHVGPYSQYYVAPAALGALLAGRVCGLARRRIPLALTAALLLVTLMPAAPAVLRHAGYLARSIDPDRWTGVQAHRSAVGIARALERRGASGHVATVYPIVAIDANRVRPEFAAGPFFFRVADFYSAERAVELNGVGPATLDRLFAVSPPAAIVGGFGPFRFAGMDAALIDYARRAGYVLVADDWSVAGYGNGQLWMRPTP